MHTCSTLACAFKIDELIYVQRLIILALYIAVVNSNFICIRF